MKRMTMIGVMVCALVLNWLPSHVESAVAAVGGVRTPVSGVRQARVIEHQVSPDGPATRLQLVQLAKPGEFEFQVDYPKQQNLARANGEGRISKGSLFIRFKGSRSKNDITFLAKAGASNTTITLSKGQLSFKLVINEYVRTRMNEARQLASNGGSEAGLLAVAREVDDQLQMSAGYKPFIEQVKRSPAFEALVATRSLSAALSTSEIDGNSGFAGIMLAARYLTPNASNVSKVSQSRVPVKVQPTRVSYKVATRTSPQLSCSDCTSWWFSCCVPFCAATGIIFGDNWETICHTACFVEWLYCIT